jgi:excisionase family DNA binding protein
MATNVSQPLENLLRATPEEEKTLEQLRAQIDDIFRRQRTARLIDPDGKTTEIPESVFHALKLVVQSMARGQTVTLVPHDKDLTTQEAAGILHVSRPHLVKLLDQGVIPHHKVGTHRRVQVEDVLAYRSERDTTRREKLDELIRISEELPGGYR